jgi:glycosyltransferase involved in cell wall biosynthesis
MRVLLVHNAYGKPSGEEVVVDETRRLLAAGGYEVNEWRRASADIPGMPLGDLRAFFSGIYSWSARRAFAAAMGRQRPDLVHIHNLYPLISPSIIDAAWAAGVPTVMTLHNYRMLCPSGLLLSRGEVCHRCAQGSELSCVLRNCVDSVPKSLGYAARNWFARKRGVFDKVTRFIALTEFQRRELSVRLPGDRIRVVPNPVPIPVEAAPPAPDGYVGFAGRLSPEKGVDILIEAARCNPALEFRFAGDWTRMRPSVAGAPSNCRFLGFLGKEELAGFYAGARVMVLPSIWYEALPNSLLEAMAYGKVVLCSHIGALPDIVEPGVAGFTFETGSAQALSDALQSLWPRQGLIDAAGARAREKVRRDYSDQDYGAHLLEVYREALACPVGRGVGP